MRKPRPLFPNDYAPAPGQFWMAKLVIGTVFVLAMIGAISIALSILLVLVNWGR